MGNLNERRGFSQKKLNQLSTLLRETETRMEGLASVYLTGSYARGEANQWSDLDLFIVGTTTTGPDGDGPKRSFSELDTICAKADLIKVVRTVGLSDFSGDGEYLTHYTVHELTQNLGTRDDDYKNTFTARLLLLLESQSLVGAQIHQQAIEQVIDAYWRDFQGNEQRFLPAFLSNDILRLWRTFCVNYEARTKKEPSEARAKRKLHNTKLRHSRLLTCYSALLHLAATHKRHGTVTPQDALLMAQLTPTQRIEQLPDTGFVDCAELTTSLLKSYDEFLHQVDGNKKDLLHEIQSSNWEGPDPTQMGNVVQKLLEIVSSEKFYRMLIV